MFRAQNQCRTGHIGYAAWLDAACAVMSGLTGKRILITRASGQVEDIAKRIRQRGGRPVAFPCLAVQCCPESIHQSVRLLKDGDVHALFTSTNGAHCVAAALRDDFVSTFESVPVVAIGHHTAKALSDMGVQVAWIPRNASQEGLMDAYRQRGLPARLVLFRAEQGRNMLPEALKAAGVDVHLIPAYRTICPDDDAGAVVQSLKDSAIDAVLLGSSRTAQHYVRRISETALANRPVIAVISGQVADAARALNLDVQVVAKEASFASMLDDLEVWFQKMTANGESHA